MKNQHKSSEHEKEQIQKIAWKEKKSEYENNGTGLEEKKVGRRSKWSCRKLKRAIRRGQRQKVRTILKQNSSLLFEGPQNCLLYACLQDKQDIVSIAFENSILESNKVNLNQILIECIRNDRINMVKFLIEKGCSPNTIVPHPSLQLTNLDYAILGGHYQISLYLYPLMNHRSKKLKSCSQYMRIAKKLKYRFVNYDMLLDDLINMRPGENCHKYLSPFPKSGNCLQCLCLILPSFVSRLLNKGIQDGDNSRIRVLQKEKKAPVEAQERSQTKSNAKLN